MAKIAEIKPIIKKVNIDDHIKSSGKKNQSSTKGKRGRPRKDRAQSNIEHTTIGSGAESLSADQQESYDGNIDHSQQHKVEPVYDTTEEAKGFLCAPFAVAAGLAGIPELNLYPEELNALAPSFKIVYDKRIAPYMGENADLIAFTMVAAGIVFKKVQVIKAHQEKNKPVERKQATDSSGMPFIPTEAHA
jgi:hypothetical protein